MASIRLQVQSQERPAGLVFQRQTRGVRRDDQSHTDTCPTDGRHHSFLRTSAVQFRHVALTPTEVHAGSLLSRRSTGVVASAAAAAADATAADATAAAPVAVSCTLSRLCTVAAAARLVPLATSGLSARFDVVRGTPHVRLPRPASARGEGMRLTPAGMGLGGRWRPTHPR